MLSNRSLLCIYFIYSSISVNPKFLTYPFPPSSPLVTKGFLFISSFASFLKTPHISDIMYLYFSVWLSMIISRSSHAAANGMISFIFYDSVIFHCVWTPHLDSFISHGHLGCFHVLATVNSATMNIKVHVSFRISVFAFFGYIPRSGTVTLFSVF